MSLIINKPGYGVADWDQMMNANLAAIIADSEAKEEKDIDLQNQINVLSNPNLLINGGPLLWQRGASFVNLQQYTADRWLYVCYANSSALGSLSKDTDGSMKMTNFNTVQNYIEQIMETALCDKLVGKKLTLSADIKVSNMTQGSLFLQMLSSSGTDKIDLAGTIVTDKLIINQSDVSNEYRRFSFTFTVPDSAKTLVPQIGSVASMGAGMVNSSCIVNLKNVKLEIGDKATPYVPKLASQEWLDCLRFYRVLESGQLMGQFDSPANCRIFSNLIIPMRTIPTLSFPANGQVTVDVIGSGNVTGGTCSLGGETNNFTIHFDIFGLSCAYICRQVRAVFSLPLDSELY